MYKVRIGDVVVGTCIWPPPVGPTPAVGIVSTGDPTDLSAGMPSSGMGDIVIWPCGAGIIAAALPNDITMQPRANLGMPVLGGNNYGVLSSGNPTDISI